MPADWWDSPTAVGCPLSRGPQSARAARRLTRNTLRDWGLAFLAEDAETIVGEFVANAVTHAAAAGELPPQAGGGEPGAAPAPPHRRGDLRRARPVATRPRCSRRPASVEESGRGLQMVDALSDVWGWSPVAGRGKAVWAILFCA